MLHCTDCVEVEVLFVSVVDNWLRLSLEESFGVDISPTECDGGAEDW